MSFPDLSIATEQCRCANAGLLMTVGEELGYGEGEGQGSGRKAADGEHECKPAEIRVRSLAGDAAEEELDGQRCHNSGGEDCGAGGEELAGVWLHGEGGRVEAFCDVGTMRRPVHG